MHTGREGAQTIQQLQGARTKDGIPHARTMPGYGIAGNDTNQYVSIRMLLNIQGVPLFPDVTIYNGEKLTISTHWSLYKMEDILQKIFEMQFLQRNYCILNKVLTKVSF